MTEETTETMTGERPLLRELGGNLYDWQPGNMTRYYIAFTQTKKGPLLTWLDKDTGGTSFLFIDVAQEQVGIGYFMEKMRLKYEGDAKALLDFAIRMGAVKRYY